MNQVAKLVIIDHQGQYLMLYRNNHPLFGDDPDISGGTMETDELPIETMMREVNEEIGIVINPATVQLIYEGTDYSENGVGYSLYLTKLDARPELTMSWEHSTYDWLSRKDFLDKAEGAIDRYMRMVYEVVKQQGK